MIRFFKAFYMTLGMFIAIPLPVFIWDEDCVDLMMPCFPFVGAVIGLLWWGTAEALIFFGVHDAIAAAALTLATLFTAGLIHLDGYMDTSDAVLSRRPLEERIRILKDPHTGSFSVIMVVALFMAQFAAAFAIIENGRHTVLLVIIAVLSRCGSAFATLVLTPAPHSSNVNMYRDRPVGILHKATGPVIAIAASAIAYLVAGVGGLIVSASAVLGYTCAMAYVYNDLKGVSGDLAGFSLVLSELCGLIALALVSHA